MLSKFESLGFRVTLDDSEEKLGYRMRNSVIKKIPYTIVLGDKEKENKTLTYRRYGSEKQINISLDEFINLLNKEINEKKLLVNPKDLKL